MKAVSEIQFKSLEATSFGTSPYDGSPEMVVLRNVSADVTKSPFGTDVIVLSNEANPAERKSISLKRGVPANKASYDFVTLTAQRDANGIAPNGKAWAIKAGVTRKTFAI